MTGTVADALIDWGGHDRDDPFGLYAAVREHGPVHPVTLTDGHPAFLVVGFDEARAALKDPTLSKDMQAAMVLQDEVVSEGLPGPEFARYMLGVDRPRSVGVCRRCWCPPPRRRRTRERRPPPMTSCGNCVIWSAARQSRPVTIWSAGWSPPGTAPSGSRTRNCCRPSSSSSRLAVGVDELHWGHGDGLVLRGLSELPVILG